jgi:hypothetical protein
MPSPRVLSTETDPFPLPSNPECVVHMAREATYRHHRRATVRAFESGVDKAKDPLGWWVEYVVGGIAEMVTEHNLTDAAGKPLDLYAWLSENSASEDGDFLFSLGSERFKMRSQEKEVPFVKGSPSTTRATRSSRRRSSKT